MTSGGARRGRRDNGLVAAAYAAAGDVDPRVGEHLLDVLALRGIAAYLQPAADLHPVTRTTTLPARPTDRLFVDREHLDTARGFLAQLADEAQQEPDLDEVFAGIVADFDTEAQEVTWPAAEDLDDEDEDEDDEERESDHEPPARLQRWRRSTVNPLPRYVEPDDDTDADDDEGYTPPPPPPLPRVSFMSVVAVLAVVAGFVVFFNPDLLPVDSSVAMVLGFAGILAGFVALIWRLRSGYDDDDDDWDSDDGAVV